MSPEDAQLLDSITTLLADGENKISIPLTALNQGIAQLSTQSARQVATLQSRLLKSIEKYAVENDNAVDSLGMAVLAPLQAWQDENYLLLTQLAAASGLVQPGDPLEAALTTQLAEEPQLALSATLVLYLDRIMQKFDLMIEVFREIRDRMPARALRDKGETPAADETDEQEADTDTSYSWLGSVEEP